MLLGKSFDDIDATTIASIVKTPVSETIQLDLKRDTYGGTDKDKKELLKDVSAFANALGGHLIIGVDEEEGAASKIVPITDVNIDDELQRLEQVIRTGVEPSLVGMRMKSIEVEGGNVILIYVPRSFSPPHRVIFKNSNRYFARNSSGVHELSLAELRALFGEQRSIEERAKTFVNERFLRVQANEGMMRMPVEDGVMAIHLVPLPDFGAKRRISLGEIEDVDIIFSPVGSTSYSGRINLDGKCWYRGGTVCHGYTQLFRDGSVEAVRAKTVGEVDGRNYLPGLRLAEDLLATLPRYFDTMRRLEASAPILFSLSFSGVRGARLGLSEIEQFMMYDEPIAYDRDVLRIPDRLIGEYSASSDYTVLIREQMDLIWNAFGLRRCQYFDDKGTWKGGQ